MRPRLEACWFGSGPAGEGYARLARVLEHTARAHCPGWVVNVERQDPPPVTAPGRSESDLANTQKLQHWTRQVLEATDGECLLLIDADTAILRSLDSIWSLDFDVAYCLREHALPLNAGVVFLRVSERTRAFFRTWLEINLRLLSKPEEHYAWRRKYAGMNQSALGCLLETIDHGCRLLPVSCREWNCCDWEFFDPAVTRILHVKSRLRLAVFDVCPTTRATMAPATLWRELERAALREAR